MKNAMNITLNIQYNKRTNLGIPTRWKLYVM